MKKINENALAIIVKEENIFKVRYLDFGPNKLLEDDSFKDMVKLLNSNENDWKKLKEKGFKLFQEVKKNNLDYFHLRRVLINPGDSYSEASTLGIDNIVREMDKQVENKSYKFLVKRGDEEYYYNLTQLVERLKLTAITHLYYKTVELAKKQKALAYSHRVRGWNTSEFKLDNDFILNVDTNFGYGYSSYFTTTIKFREIPIIPFTKIILYRYARKFSIINYTESYSVSFESFKDAYEFTADKINEFNSKGRDTFIYNYLVKSLDNFISLLPELMRDSTMFLINSNRFDSYLNLEERKKIYNYNNIMHRINMELLMELVEKVSKSYHYSYNFGNKLDNLIEGINIKDLSDLEIKEYAFAMVKKLENTLFRNDKWINIDDEKYNKIIECLINSIFFNKSIVKEFGIETRRGFSLLEFRNERLMITKEMLENIKGLEHIIDSNRYVKSINYYISEMIQQNNRFLRELNIKINNQERFYEISKNNYEAAYQDFSKTDVFINYQALNSFFDAVNDFLRNVENEKEELIDNIKIKEVYNELKILLNKNKNTINILSNEMDFTLISKEKSIILIESPNPNKDGDELQEIERQKVLKEVISFWQTIISNLNLDYEIFVKEFINNLNLNNLVNSIKEFYNRETYRGFLVFERNFKEYNTNYLEIYKEYQERNIPIVNLRGEMEDVKKILDELNNQKSKIEEYNLSLN
jgi:hypothetical protein